MRKYILLGAILTGFFVKSQEVSVEKNLFGVQLGLINTSFQYETKLQKEIALRTEVGLDLVTSTKEYDNPAIKDETASLIIPYLKLEPRWYYGLDRRFSKGKNIKNNSSNYLSLSISYNSNKTPIVNTGSFDVVSALLIIPKYGIRRAFAKHFNYEFSGGIGYQSNIFNDSEGCDCDHNQVALDLQARIGYQF